MVEYRPYSIFYTGFILRGYLNAAVAAVAVLAVTLVILIGVYVDWIAPTGVTPYAFVFGTRGAADLMLGAVTLGAGVVTIYFLGRRALHDDRTLLDTRFRESITMLADDKDSISMAGSNTLSMMARDRPLNFLGPAAISLIGTLIERTRDQWRPIAAHIETTPPNLTKLPTIRPSTMSEVQALMAIGSLRRPKVRGWPSGPGPAMDGRMHISHITLGKARFNGRNFADMDFYGVGVHQVEFIGSDFTNSTMRLFGYSDLRFTDCDLTNLTIEACDFSFVHPGEAACELTVLVHDSVVNGATMNGSPLLSTPRPSGNVKQLLPLRPGSYGQNA